MMGRPHTPAAPPRPPRSSIATPLAAAADCAPLRALRRLGLDFLLMRPCAPNRSGNFVPSRNAWQPYCVHSPICRHTASLVLYHTSYYVI